MKGTLVLDRLEINHVCAIRRRPADLVRRDVDFALGTDPHFKAEG